MSFQAGRNSLVVIFFILIMKNGFCLLDNDKIINDLNLFEQEPNKFFNLIPQKKRLTDFDMYRFGREEEYINYTGLDIDRKFRDRGELCRKLSGNDNCHKVFKENFNDLSQMVADFLQIDTNRIVVDIKKINESYPFSSKTNVDPWSDYYWPFYNGALGFRYSDGQFPETTNNFEEKYNYVMVDNSADKFLASLFALNSDSIVENLSAAEKYDLLMNDKNWTLTNKMWSTSKQYLVNGEIESWMGLCHGWAPASYKMARPDKSIVVKSADGKTKIKFYPSDVKALSTLLWAEANYDNKFIGERCNLKTPVLDANGRIVNRSCFDVNPAVWHLIALNKMGKSKSNFVIDVTYDRQVWNQPVTAYEYSYFNPVTKTPGKFDKSVISKESFTNDKFKKYRSRTSTYVVGVAMELVYIIENYPSTLEADSSASDIKQSVTYYYDLELDSNFNIVGGEWYQNAHPDFIWGPEDSAFATGALTLENAASGTWEIGNPLPVSWAKAGQKSSAYSIPLAKIVNQLINFTKETL